MRYRSKIWRAIIYKFYLPTKNPQNLIEIARRERVLLKTYALVFRTESDLKAFQCIIAMGGGHDLERQNVERPIFRNLKIANIKITKDELFDNFIFEINFSFFRNHLNTQNI